MKKRLLGAAALLAALAVPSPALAAERDGVLENGEFGLYHRTDRTLVLDLTNNDPDLRNDVFPGTTLAVYGNTGTMWNRDTVYWEVSTGANHTGARGCIAPGFMGSPSSTFRPIASARWTTLC